MTYTDFKEICILSGTDYNMNTNANANANTNNINTNLLKNIIEIHKKFKEYNNTTKSNNTFYNWVNENTNYITNIELLTKINNMFDLNINNEKLKIFNNISITYGPIKQNEIENIMKEEDFIFCKT
jgi:hypothetical protein